MSTSYELVQKKFKNNRICCFKQYTFLWYNLRAATTRETLLILAFWVFVVEIYISDIPGCSREPEPGRLVNYKENVLSLIFYLQLTAIAVLRLDFSCLLLI